MSKKDVENVEEPVEEPEVEADEGEESDEYDVEVIHARISWPWCSDVSQSPSPPPITRFLICLHLPNVCTGIAPGSVG